jgi:hypothetical protein
MATPLFTDEELKIIVYNDQSYIIENKDFYEMQIKIAIMNVSLFCHYYHKEDVLQFTDKLKYYIVSLIIYKLATDYYNDDGNKEELITSLKTFKFPYTNGDIYKFLSKINEETDYKILYRNVFDKNQDAIIASVAPMPPSDFVIGGADKASLIDVITLNTLNSIILFNKEKLNTFIANVNKFK